MSYKIRTSEHASWTIVELCGRIDSFNDRMVLEELEPLMARATGRFALELSGCESVNLRILRELMRWSEHLRFSGGELILLTPPMNIKRHVEIFVGPHRIRQFASLADLSLMQAYGPEHLPETFSSLG